MGKLDKVVLIAGKNGSGKTRLLHNISTALAQVPVNHSQLTIEINDFNSELQRLRGLEVMEASAVRAENTIVSYERAVKEREVRLTYFYSFELFKPTDDRQVINFVPKALEMTDPFNIAPADLHSRASNLDANLGIGSSPHSTLAKIQIIQSRYHNATHPKKGSSITEDEIKTAIENYESLRDSIKEFLGTDLDSDLDGNFTLFGKAYRDASLSDGQKVLIQLCLALHTQKGKLSEAVIFLDEPENHLHPEALIYVVNSIQRVLTNGQLWVATHSVHLLAHFPSSSIWYMEDGSVGHAGKAPERVLKGLMGGDDEIVKLANFLILPALMASAQFAFECLFPPLAMKTGSDDPQTSQIIEAIQEKLQNREKIRVLDFGAGQGRLLSAIKDIESVSGIEVADWLDYVAYDSFHQSQCESIISEVYGSANQRYFSDSKKLLSDIKFHTFDMIVMCNVFHEIDPLAWLHEFSEHSIVRNCLKSDGILLVVEDQLIPIGEKAYENGFLVFDTVQFKKLFLIEKYEYVSRKDGRLKAHFIPASSLGNITEQTRRDAISSLKSDAFDEIKLLRKKSGSTSNGRLHAFWSQQAVNSSLVLEQLGGN